MANPKDELKKELQNMAKSSKLIQKMRETKNLKRKADKALTALNKGIAESLKLDDSDE